MAQIINASSSGVSTLVRTSYDKIDVETVITE